MLDELRIGLGELVRVLGTSRQSIWSWRREGMPALTDSKGRRTEFDARAVLTWLTQTGRGQAFKADKRPIDLQALERFIESKRPAAPVHTSALAKFPDPRTIAAIEAAECASMVQSAAVLVRLLGLEPRAALLCWLVVTGELSSAFDDANGLDTGPSCWHGEALALYEDGGQRLICGRIAQLARELPDDIEVGFYCDEDEYELARAEVPR